MHSSGAPANSGAIGKKNGRRNQGNKSLLFESEGGSKNYNKRRGGARNFGGSKRSPGGPSDDSAYDADMTSDWHYLQTEGCEGSGFKKSGGGGRKKQNLNHLLNFKFEPRANEMQDGGRSGQKYGRKSMGGKKNGNKADSFRPKYKKEQYLQAK